MVYVIVLRRCFGVSDALIVCVCLRVYHKTMTTKTNDEVKKKIRTCEQQKLKRKIKACELKTSKREDQHKHLEAGRER